MKTRLTILLGSILAITPVSAAAQEVSPAPLVVDHGLVGELCAAAAADSVEQDECMAAVEAALAEMIETPVEEPVEKPGLLEQAQSIVDDTVELVDDAVDQAREIDLEAALDDALEGIEDLHAEVTAEVQGAIDDAVSAFEDLELDEIDIEAVIDEAVAEALATAEEIDLQTTIDEALAEAQVAIEEADLQGVVDETVAVLEESVEEARAIVAAAQTWAQENRDAVCRGGSVSLGTTVGVAVFAMTGVEWLGLQAFWATERFTNSICGDFVE